MDTVDNLINSMSNMDVKDYSREKRIAMRYMLDNHHIYGDMLKDFMDILAEFNIVNNNVNPYFYNIDIDDLVYNYLCTDGYRLEIMSKFIKFIYHIIPGEFHISDVLYCLENYDQ
jgi:hypothetical protein